MQCLGSAGTDPPSKQEFLFYGSHEVSQLLKPHFVEFQRGFFCRLFQLRRLFAAVPTESLPTGILEHRFSISHLLYYYIMSSTVLNIIKGFRQMKIVPLIKL